VFYHYFLLPEKLLAIVGSAHDLMHYIFQDG